jgi:hypothetical protein
MTTTITIKDKPVNATYQNITGLTGGAGVEAAFDVTWAVQAQNLPQPKLPLK